jgi:4-hydroxybenzoyl-CoA thioesterase
MPRTTIHRVQVQFGDCDPAQIAFFPNYFRWCDAATLHFFTSGGMVWRDPQTPGGLVGIPVVEVGCKFLRPTTYDDALEVHTRVEEWREKTFVMKHEIRRNGELLAEAREVRVFAIRHPEDPKRIKAVPPPEDIRRQCD